MVNDREVLQSAIEVIEQVLVGCLATVDEQGHPHQRYMAAVALNGDLTWLYSLSAAETRKTEHLRHNRAICWCFATSDYETVVTLRGQAREQTTTDMPESAWNRLIEFAKPYAVNVLTDEHHHDYEAIVSHIETVEVISPKMSLHAPHRITL